MGAIKDDVQRIVQEWLASRDEDAMWLRQRPKGREWHEAYLRLLERTIHQMARSMGWIKFCERREEVIQAVREIVG